MDITRENFADKLDELKEVIDQAAFIAIDGEFTGLDTNEEDISRYDKLSEYYTKVSQTAKEYIMIQLGFTAFRLATPSTSDTNATFTYRSYNFFIYPRARRKRFMCQGSSLEFLATNNFNFNKLFHHGISYCDKKEELELLERFAEKEKWLAEPDEQEEIECPVEVPDDEKEKLDHIKDVIEKFLISDDEEKVIDNTNAFQRKLIYQLIENSFRSRVSASSRVLQNKRKVLVVARKRTPEQEMELRQEKLKKEEQELSDAIGFRKFMDMLSKSKKLIIGHNMLLDVMFSMQMFFEPLPNSLKTFKHTTHKTFPFILDTKYLCQADKLKEKLNSTVLSRLYETINEKPFQLPKCVAESNEYGYSKDNPKEHEAGYDSYITGLCFIALAAQLNVEPSDMNEKSKALYHYMNKLFVFQLAHNSFIHLTGKEPEPNRDHIFHVTTPPHWVLSSIFHHFRNYGAVYVSWTGPNAAYVALSNREHAPIIVRSIDKPDGFTIESFDNYQLRKHANSNSDDDQPQKRKIDDTKATSDEPSKKRKKKKNQNTGDASGSKTSTAATKPFEENNDW